MTAAEAAAKKEMGIAMESFRRARLLEAAVVALCATAASNGASAQSSGFTFGVSAGAGYSDNITRVPDDEVEETLGTVGITLNAQSEGRLSYSAIADASYVEYLDDTFDSEVVGGFDGFMNYAFVPDRFSWTFEDTFGQAQQNLFRPDTPDNRESVNFFSTGPDIALPIGGRNFFDIGGRYSDARYEDSALDNTRVGGSAGFRRQLSTSTLVALNVASDTIEYDDVDTEYDVQSAFVRYAVDTSRTLLAIDAGVTELDREGETSDGTLFRLDFARELSSATSLLATAGQRFSDASDVFRVLQRRSSVDPETSPTETTSDAFKYRYATLGWLFEKNRTDFRIAVGFNQERYVEQTERDREYVDYSLEIGRRISPATRVSLSARWYENEYDNVAFESEDLRLRGAVSWRAGARTWVGLQIDYLDRGSSQALSEYTENRALLTVSYFPRGQQF